MELQVSKKGAVSVYYLNRYPFTLHRDEWEAVFGARRMIWRFIATHHLQLSCRCDEETRQAFRDVLARAGFGDETRVGALWCKKATTGAVSLYGLRRFPVTLYCDQWLRVLGARDEIEQFIRANDARLERKGCCVPRARSNSSRVSGVRTVVGPDNIIRPVAAMSRDR
jgi:hypothetical protein